MNHLLPIGPVGGGKDEREAKVSCQLGSLTDVGIHRSEDGKRHKRGNPIDGKDNCKASWAYKACHIRLQRAKETALTFPVQECQQLA